MAITKQDQPRKSAHITYLMNHFNQIANQLISGSIDSKEFASIQTNNFLNLEKRMDYDSLEGNFLNERGFQKNLSREFVNINRRIYLNGTLVVLDSEGLNQSNLIISCIGQAIEEQTRANDLKARVKENQFSIFLIGAKIKNAQIVAQRIQRSIKLKLTKSARKNGVTTTLAAKIKIGITQVRFGDSTTTLTDRAQQALDKAKKLKRKSIVFIK